MRSIYTSLLGGHFNGIEFASWVTSIRVQYASKLVHGLVTYSEQNFKRQSHVRYLSVLSLLLEQYQYHSSGRYSSRLKRSNGCV